MAFALHLIWLGHAPSLRAMQNLCHVLNLFESELSNIIHMPRQSMQQLALFCASIFVHLRDAHVGSTGRQEHVLAVKRLCNDFSLI